MKILFSIINYDTSNLTVRLVSSISASIKNSTYTVTTDANVIIYCNHRTSNDELEKLSNSLSDLNVPYEIVSDNLNTGYLGRLKDLQQRTLKSNFDLIVYCNSDLVLDLTFIKELEDVIDEIPKSCGIIAPSIISKSSGQDSNPKYLKRLSIRKLSMLRKIYSNHLLFYIYKLAGYIKEKIKGYKRRRFSAGQSQIKESQDIYAAHGAMFIFKSCTMFQNLTQHVCFMFGEEIHIAENALKLGFTTRYIPTLIIHDDQHASINSIPSTRVRIWYKESIEGLINKYY